MRTNRRIWRAAVVIAVALASTACDFELGTRGGKVFNDTTKDVIVEVTGLSEAQRRELPALRSGQWNAPDGQCLGTGIAVYSTDGELLANLDEPICDGRTVTIEDTDLDVEP